jgi:GH24 family phage-related lysozyme (muramidase)
MNVSSKAINIIKSMKGFRPKPHTDPYGRTLIGYGHVVVPGDGVAPLDIINTFKASSLLMEDVELVSANLDVPSNISQEEFDNLIISSYK